MNIRLKAYGIDTLKIGLPKDGVMRVPAGCTLKNALTTLRLPVPPGGSLLLFVNGRPKTPDHILTADDTVVLLPPMEGG